jgi:hypothetical protein
MTKTVEEVRRAAFEAHMNVNHPSISLRCYGEAQGCIGCNDYEDDMASAMYAAFNAALDAVEIQLPKTCAYESLDSARVFVQLTYEIGSSAADPVELVRLDDCRAAIEQTGLGLRVK